MSERALLKPAAAAAYLCVKPKTLKRLVDAGQIRWIDAGTGLRRKQRRFTLADLDQFIEQRSRQSVPGPASCQSTSRRTRHITPSTSATVVYGFTELQKRRQSAKPGGSN